MSIKIYIQCLILIFGLKPFVKFLNKESNLLEIYGNKPSLVDTPNVYILFNEEKLPINSVFVDKARILSDLQTFEITKDKIINQPYYDYVLNNAKVVAKKIGANIVQISESNNGVLTRYAYQLNFYRNLDIDSLSFTNERNKSLLPAVANYAMVYFYKASKFQKYAIKNSNDSIIGQLRQMDKFAFKTSTFGKQTFYVDNKTKYSIEINIEKGKEYFVECTINGASIEFKGYPKLLLQSVYEGRHWYNGVSIH